MNFRLEVVTVPVSDVDRAKAFYAGLGWRLDADIAAGDAFRVVQFTPPGSDCSIQVGKGRSSAAPGSAQALFLVVPDIEQAHKDLSARNVAVSEIFHAKPGEAPQNGPDPERRSYMSFLKFSDPDGNGWLVQEITHRLPGRGGPDPVGQTTT
jgi:catechol 2,3-dioxygenase-like lactoylglutathione lyase family enzyme